MKYFIITGTSRGLGQALAEKLMGAEHHLICISRSENQRLTTKARDAGFKLDFFAYDLNDVEHLDSFMGDIFGSIDLRDAEAIILVNNAGTLDPIKPVSDSDLNRVIKNIHINLLAPMLLSAAFIKLTADFSTDKRIINVSSGAGKKPYYGWSSYCSAKAAIDMFTRCVALEATYQLNPVKVVSFGPGIMDTDMQAEIRNTPENDFVQLQKFIEFKKDGKLLPAEQVADILISLMFADVFPHGEFVDVYSLMPTGV